MLRTPPLPSTLPISLHSNGPGHSILSQERATKEGAGAPQVEKNGCPSKKTSQHTKPLAQRLSSPGMQLGFSSEEVDTRGSELGIDVSGNVGTHSTLPTDCGGFEITCSRSPYTQEQSKHHYQIIINSRNQKAMAYKNFNY